MKTICVVLWRTLWIVPYSLAWTLAEALAFIMYGPVSWRNPEAPRRREAVTAPGSADALLRMRPLRVLDR